MRTITLLLLISFSLPCFSQLDTLYKMNGEKLLITVTEITESSIKFTYPNESFSNTIAKSTVSKIHFKSGRVQEFSSALNVSNTKSCLDWENVQISKIESEVQGLQKIDVIGAKAKGLSTLSSIGKLQDRAFDKIKIETAMLGGNVAYIMEQNTEEAIYGGQYGSSKLPSVTISGLAYTTKKVFRNEISFGDYKISKMYVLATNAYNIEDYLFRPQELSIQDDDIFEENGFQKIKLNISSIPKVVEYTLIYADEMEIVLSGVESTKNGKNTYYNIILKK
jgi:hypothetical protein